MNIVRIFLQGVAFAEGVCYNFGTQTKRVLITVIKKEKRYGKEKI